MILIFSTLLRWAQIHQIPAIKYINIKYKILVKKMYLITIQKTLTSSTLL